MIDVVRSRDPFEPMAPYNGTSDEMKAIAKHCRDNGLYTMYRWNGILLDKLRQLPGFVDVNSNLKNQSPTIALDVDRDKLAPLGLTFGQVEDALQSAFSSRQISTIYGATNQYQVILELAPEFQADPAALSKIYVRSAGGRLVPVDTVARISRSTLL